MEIIDFVILFVFLCGAAFVWHKSQKKKGKAGLDPLADKVMGWAGVVGKKRK